MPTWTTLSLTQLRAATKAQIIQNVGQWMAVNLSKRDLIAWLMDADYIPDRTIVTRDNQSRVIKRIDVNRDPETGVVIGGRVMTWQYFNSGEIRYIVVSDRDGDDVETRRQRISHSRDGQSPVIRDIALVENIIEVEP